MIHHHPDDELLLARAAGTLDSGTALVVSTHAEFCPQCRERLRGFEALGGAVLESIEPATLATDAWARTLARIDAASPRQVVPKPAARIQAHLPDEQPWPKALAGCSISRWRPLGPGRRWARISVPSDRGANLFLLRIAAGLAMPWHSHRGLEVTQVLHGSFEDGRAVFGPGDFDATDPSVRHQPVVLAQGECVCLAAVQGRLLFDSAAARLLGALVGL
ncbi:MAG: ChrR family anti-sigma-E factor [Burkholderiales bacterium]